MVSDYSRSLKYRVFEKGAQATVYRFIKDDGKFYATKMTPIKDYLQTGDESRN